MKIEGLTRDDFKKMPEGRLVAFAGLPQWRATALNELDRRMNACRRGEPLFGREPVNGMAHARALERLIMELEPNYFQKEKVGMKRTAE